MTRLLSSSEITQQRSELDSRWAVDEERRLLSREFHFGDYAQTMAFANAVAWIAQREDHHPDLWIGYSRCRVDYSTHSVGGLSELDFRCARAIDQLATHA